MKKLIILILLISCSNAFAIIGSFRSARPMTINVAANDAVQAIKDGADYVCTGTDDQVEINLALADGAVELSAGTFNISDSVLMLDDSTLRGQGPGSILKRTQIDDYAIIWSSIKTNVLISDLVTDGNKSVLGDPANLDADQNVNISRSFNVTLLRVLSRNSPGQGIQILASDNLDGLGGGNIRVLQCTSIDNAVRGLYAQGILDGVLFDNCYVEGNDFSGILVGMNLCTNITVSNCFFKNNGDVTGPAGGTRPEIEMQAFDGLISSGVGAAGRSRGLSFVNNTVIRDEAPANYTTANSMMMFVGPYMRDVLISGNNFVHHVEGQYYGIEITGPVSNLKFTNNTYTSSNTSWPSYPVRLQITSTPSIWVADTEYRNMNTVIPIAGVSGFRYIANVTDVDNRTSGSGEPTWPLYEGGTVVDNDITWEAVEDHGVYNSVFADNQFFTDAYSFGIIEGKHKNIQFIGNVFSCRLYGNIYFGSVTNPSSHLLFEGNTFVHRSVGATERYLINDADTETDYCIVKNNFWTSQTGLENLGAGVGGGDNNVVSDNLEN